jgi:hypothetical protein
MNLPTLIAAIGRRRRAGYPLPLTAPGIVAIYDAAALLTSPVASWADRPLGTKSATQGNGAKQPLWAASHANFNGQPVVTDNAGAAGTVLLTATPSDWTFLNNGLGMTIAGVARATNTTNRYLLDTTAGSGVSRGVNISMQAGNNLRLIVGQGATVISLPGACSLNTTHKFIATHLTGDVGADAHLRIDGAATASGNNAAVPSALAPVAPLSIGNFSDPAPNVSWLGQIAFLAFWNRVLTGAEQTIVEAYFQTRFGV